MEWRGETGFCAVPVLMLLRLSHFSRVRLCAAPKMAAHQAPLSLGFFQAITLEWVAISFSSAWKWKVTVQSLRRVQLLATPWDCSPPGSSVHGTFQARVLEWGVIAFSECCRPCLSPILCFLSQISGRVGDHKQFRLPGQHVDRRNLFDGKDGGKQQCPDLPQSLIVHC